MLFKRKKIYKENLKFSFVAVFCIPLYTYLYSFTTNIEQNIYYACVDFFSNETRSY